MADLEIDMREPMAYIDDRLGKLKGKNTYLVLARSLKRAVTAYQTVVIRETQKKYILDNKNIKANMKITAKKNGYQLSTTSRSKLVVYYDWGTVSKKSGKRKNNFRVGERQYYGARVYKKNKLKHIVNSFWVRSKKSERGVLLSRPDGVKGKKARSVTNWLVVAPAVAQIVGNEETNLKAKERAMEILEKRIDHEVDRILSSKA